MSVGLQSRDVARIGSIRSERRILVCTGDPALERAMVESMARRGAQLQVVGDRETYLAAAAREPFDAIFLDLGDDPEPWQTDLLDHRAPVSAVVVRVPEHREAQALDAVERGASAYVVGRSSAEQIAQLMAVAAEAHVASQRLSVVEGRLAALESEDELIGHSPAMRRLMGAVSRAADNDATVLVEGKQGSGKTLVARCVHRGGRRAAEAFVVLQADSTDEEAFERALDAASGGTLVVEDVDQLSGACQSRLVRLLKDSSSRARSVRVVATTSARLAELTAKGSFREDLYYRLNMFPISVPTLVERREDVPVLAARFLRRSGERNGLPDKGFTPAAMIVLEAHPWPGNVAQLEHAVARAHGLADGGPIDRVHLFGPATGLKPPPGVKGLNDPIHEEDDELGEDDILPFHEEEKRLLGRALQATKGNVRRAAQLLGIGRATLYRKIQIYQLRLQ